MAAEPRTPRIILMLAVIERFVIGGLMAAITFLTLIQVIWRYGLNQPLTWSEEVARYCFVWVTLIGAATLLRLKDSHPELDSLRNRLAPIFRAAVDVFSRLTIVLCSLAISIGGFRMIHLHIDQLSPSLEIPMWWIYLSMAVPPLIGIFWILWRAKFGPVEDQQ
ncbi:MAG: TRAP transporter small permease [Pseudomonadota bacterium]